jgi:hypothetical protein
MTWFKRDKSIHWFDSNVESGIFELTKKWMNL